MHNKNNSQSDMETEAKIEAMKLEIAQLKAIQFAMPDPYYVRDMDYNVVFWPDPIAKLTGYSAEEAKKLKCYQMFKACVCPPGSQGPTQNCIKTRQFLKDVAVDVYHKNGSTVHTLVSNAGVYDEQGNAIGAVEIVKDNTDIQNSMDSIGELIKNMNSVLDHLVAVSDNLSKISDTVFGHSVESLNSIKTGEKACISVNEKVEYSNSHMGSVQTNMETINDSMKSSVEKISALKVKSEEINRVVDVIQNLAYKTNLLALNASIEAAKAGNFGRGFSVVAEGIKELSKNSNDSAESIRATIQEIIKLIQETIVSLTTTEKDVQAGTNSISELLKFIDEIDKASRTLIGTMSDVEKAATATSQLSKEQNVSVEESNEISKNLSKISEDLLHEFDRVSKAIQHQNMG
jgi:PAS domain S-box-containing protein